MSGHGKELHFLDMSADRYFVYEGEMAEQISGFTTNKCSANVIKVFGERNSGTNFISQLIQRNLDVRLLPGGVPRLLYRLLPMEWPRDLWFFITSQWNLGWKHRYPDKVQVLHFSRKHPLVIVTVSKNPYAWLLSMFRRPYHLQWKGGMFDDFLHTLCPVVGREKAEKLTPDPVHLWNWKHAAYRGFSELSVPWVHLRYEDVLRDPERAIGRVAEACNISQHHPFESVLSSTKGEPGKTFLDYREYYLRGEWRRKFYANQVSWINERLDANLCRMYGYDWEDPASYPPREAIL